MNDDAKYVETDTPERVMQRRADLAAKMQAHADRMQHYIRYGGSAPRNPPSAVRPASGGDARSAQPSAG